jgi:hypothetical protein
MTLLEESQPANVRAPRAATLVSMFALYLATDPGGSYALLSRTMVPEDVADHETCDLQFLGVARDFETAMDALEDVQRRLSRKRRHVTGGVGRSA